MNAPAASRSGFSLVEVTMALGIMAFCLVAILGLIPVGLNTNAASIETTAMTAIAADVMTDLRSTPVTTSGAAATSGRFLLKIPAAGSSNTAPQTIYFGDGGAASGQVGASPVTSGTGFSRYRASVFFPPSQGAASKAPSPVRIFVTRPALADPSPLIAPTKYASSFEAVTALDRN